MRLLREITDQLQRVFYGEVTDSPTNCTGLEKSIAKFAYTVDGVDECEAYFQALLSVSLLYIPGWSHCALDKTLCKGDRHRPDLVISSRRRKAGMCIELKWDDGKKNNPQDEKYGLGQIAKNRYLTKAKPMQNKDIETAFAIGIYVAKKNDKYKYEVRTLMESMRRDVSEDLATFLKRFEDKLKSKYPIKD
jgi:hypothetical protein